MCCKVLQKDADTVVAQFTGGQNQLTTTTATAATRRRQQLVFVSVCPSSLPQLPAELSHFTQLPSARLPPSRYNISSLLDPPFRLARYVFPPRPYLPVQYVFPPFSPVIICGKTPAVVKTTILANHGLSVLGKLLSLWPRHQNV